MRHVFANRPWTVGIYVDERTNALKLAKLQYVYRLREDLEKVRLLTELVRKREKEKLRLLRIFRSDVLHATLLSMQTRLLVALDHIMAYVYADSLDRDDIFGAPVSLEDAPDYLDVITHPMDWSTIRSRIDSYAYENSTAFVADVKLVCSNAMQYNAPDTPFHKSAQRILKQAAPILDELQPSSLEPTVAATRALRAPPPPPAGTLVGAAGDDTVDAFLEPNFSVELEKQPSAAPKVPSTPSRRSTRHTKEEPKAASNLPRRSARTSEHTATAVPSSGAAPRVDSVSAHDSFTFFDSGWILPEGSRRGNRPRPQPVASPRRVRQRTRAENEPSSDLSDVPE